MGDKILKIIEALLGGIATFFGLWFLMGFILDNTQQEGMFGNMGLGIVLLFMVIIFSFFITFVYYYLLTKNQNVKLDINLSNQNLPKSILENNTFLIALGLISAFAYFYLLSLYDGLTAFFYTIGSVFILPFILTRQKWSWLIRIICLIIVFFGGYLLAFISYS